MDGKGILEAVVALILYIIFAIIYFLILCFIIKIGANAVGAGDIQADFLGVAAAILTAGTLIAGGGLPDLFKKA